jgi:hypothetical protein
VAARSINHVVALSPQRNHFGDNLGRVLQISVNQNDCRSVGKLQAGADRNLMAEISGEPYNADSWISGVDVSQDAGGVVLASIIDKNNFERQPDFFQSSRQAAGGFRQHGFLVETRNDHSNFGLYPEGLKPHPEGSWR